jgi:hypothetical protein
MTAPQAITPNRGKEMPLFKAKWTRKKYVAVYSVR